MKKVISIMICAVMLTAASGCTTLLGSNSRANTLYLPPTETDTAYEYYILSSYGGITVSVDKTSGNATIEKSDREEEYPAVEYPTVLSGSDAPRHGYYCGEGYELLPELIKNRYETSQVKLVQYYGVEYGESGVCLGFINLYTRTSGYLSGGGRIDAKRIVAGIIFSYDTHSGKFAQLYRMEKCNIVAFGGRERAIYFSNRKYYACDLPSGEETYLFDDEAYDTGMTNYSHVNFYFNERHFIADMHHGANSEKSEYDKIVVTDYDGNVLTSKKVTA